MKADSITELFSKIKADKFLDIQLAPRRLQKNGLEISIANPGAANYLKKRLTHYDLSIAILGCYINMIHPDPAIREQELQYFEAGITASKWLNNCVIATETGSLSTAGYTEQNFTATAFNQMVTSVQRLTTFAEKVGAIIAVEPGVNHPLYDADMVAKLLKAVPSPCLKLVFDPVNLMTLENYKEQRAIISDFMARFSNKIVSFHLKDFIVQNNTISTVAFGQGQLAHEFYLELIDQNNPHTFATLEGIQEVQIPAAITAVKHTVNLDSY
jgi:sugar phosphate isomerase/epimerase